MSTIEGFHCIQDTSPGPQGVHNRGFHCIQNTLPGPKVSTIERFHCIQDTSPGPQGVHNRGVPLYTEHFTRSQGVHNREVPLYTGHFTRSQGVHNRGVPLYTGHFTRSQGVHNREVPLYSVFMPDLFFSLSVASNVSLVEGSDSCSLKELPLPKFLDRLRQSSAGLSRSRPAGQEQLMERCCQLYALARYEDGVSWLGN